MHYLNLRFKYLYLRFKDKLLNTLPAVDEVEVDIGRDFNINLFKYSYH